MTTLNSATPSTGISTGRYLITLDGTGFREPDLVPGAETAQESVRVWVDGDQVDPSDVFVRSTTKVEFRMLPSFRSVGIAENNDPHPVDIVVQNVDATGALIPGSDATLEDGFSYVKINPSIDSVMTLVTREILRHLRRSLPYPVFTLSHVDYSEGTGVMVPNGPLEASDPGVYLTGPRRQTDGVGTQRVRSAWPWSDEYSRWLPRATDLLFDLVFVSSDEIALRNIIPRLDDLVNKMPEIVLTIMGKSYGMEVWVTSPMSMQNSVVFSASLQQATGSFKVEAVPLTTEILRRNIDIDAINVTIGDLDD